MTTEKKKSLPTIYQTWRTEDRDLEACIDQVRDWMHQVAQLGVPHFGETATRLRPLRERLVTHFEREDQMVAQLGGVVSVVIAGGKCRTKTVEPRPQPAAGST